MNHKYIQQELTNKMFILFNALVEVNCAHTDTPKASTLIVQDLDQNFYMPFAFNIIFLINFII